MKVSREPIQPFGLLQAGATNISTTDKTQILAEARFQRGFFHFEAKKMWNMVHYRLMKQFQWRPANFKVPNNVDMAEDHGGLDFARKPYCCPIILEE
jgi:hypothetical protein